MIPPDPVAEKPILPPHAPESLKRAAERMIQCEQAMRAAFQTVRRLDYSSGIRYGRSAAWYEARERYFSLCYEFWRACAAFGELERRLTLADRGLA